MSKLIVPIILAATFAALTAQAKTILPTASVVMKKGYDKGAGLGTGTAQFYDHAPDNRCTGRKRLYKFSLITGAQANKPIPAGQVIFLSAYTNRYNSQMDGSVPSGVSVNTAKCESRVEFTPIAGETYEVVQKVEIGKNCTMQIIAKSSMAPPADLKEVDPATCSAKN